MNGARGPQWNAHAGSAIDQTGEIRTGHINWSNIMMMMMMMVTTTTTMLVLLIGGHSVNAIHYS